MVLETKNVFIENIKMKNNAKKILIAVSVFMFIFGSGLFSVAGAKYFIAGMLNGDSINQGNLIFSKESGFYNEEFQLRIYAPTDEVYYTLDGTDPDRSSTKYEHPILIRDASLNPNIYSMKTEVTASFLEKQIEQYSANSEKYILPDYNIDKCTVVKAAYYDKEGNLSEISERVYFVGFDEKIGYENIGIISIVTDPDNLFSDEKGIYVLGDTFESWFEENKDTNSWELAHWSFWGANYRNKGSDWERESSIQVFDKNKELILSQHVGVRIQGGGSRALLPKSLNLYAREEYGANKINFDFWDTGYYPKRMTLSIGGGDQYTKIKDRLISELAKECNIVTMNYEPYILFLNGEYWGVYHMTEKYDTQYIEYYYGVDNGNLIDNIIMIKNGMVETGVEADYYVSYSEMVEYITNADMKNSANYQKACELIDMESFIDYFAVQGYIARCGDWPDSNFALWRSRNVSEKLYEDGRWRWMLFDVNSTAMEKDLISLDVIDALRSTSEMFDNLCNNESFRKSFASRLIGISDDVFNKDIVNQKLDGYIEELDEVVENHFQRFFGTSNDKFYECIDELRLFFDNRRPYIIESIKDNFGEEYLYLR